MASLPLQRPHLYKPSGRHKTHTKIKQTAISSTEVKKLYLSLKTKIEERIRQFRQVQLKGSELDVFAELVFCILTPQSKAKSCWNCVRKLSGKNLLLHGSAKQISQELKGARFRHNKAKYIIEARKQFAKKGKISIKQRIDKFHNGYDARSWLVKNVTGLGYKEASHFLRNIGVGQDLAILDRHILKNIRALGVIAKVPNSLSKQKYLRIEKKLKQYSKTIKIPLSHLDLVLWCRQTGEVFK